MTKAVRIEKTGGPEVMQLVTVNLPKPSAGEVRVRHTAIGLNYYDTYVRSGLYPVALPSYLGEEAAGVVEDLGQNVSGLKIGDRVAYGNGSPGAYAEARNVKASHLVKVPGTISDQTAAGMMLKGMTVRYLLRASYTVKAGETILLHAAAGGVGLILSQWAKALGATVIGTVGNQDKIEIAKAHGCSQVINSSVENVVARVKEITGGKGVPVVYDGVGQATFLTSLDCLSPHGLLVSFGNASGPVQGVSLGILASKGSLYVTRPTLKDFISTKADFSKTTNDLIDMVQSGKVKIPVNQTYALSEVVQAHRDLEARKTTGTTVLIP
jgi:NADPH2:quinone reductase